MTPPINLVVEDALSEAVLRRLLTVHALESGVVYGKKGFGFIKAKLQGFNHAAKGMRYLVLTDLDRAGCAAALWSQWLPGVARHPNLIFRVAVREVESWLLADLENLGNYLAVAAPPLMSAPDDAADPKSDLLALAAKSPRRELRAALIFKSREGVLKQGPDYNGALVCFVERHWDIQRAAERSGSLQRALAAVRRLKS